MFRKLLLVILVIATGSPVHAQITRFFPQIGDGVVSGFLRFRTSVVFVNSDDADTQVNLEFFDADGNPLELTLEQPDGSNETGSSLSVALPGGGSFFAQTPGTQALVSGYIRFTAPGTVGGTAIFTGIDEPSGVTIFEAGVPATESLQEFSLFLDSIDNQDTGLAVVAEETQQGQGVDSSQEFTLTLYDTDFEQIATTDVPIQPGQRLARFIGQFFEGDPDAVEAANEMQGTVTIVSKGPDLAAVTLRQPQGTRPFPEEVLTLTTFPVVPGTPDAQLSATGSFQAIASKAAYQVEVSGVPGREALAGVRFRVYSSDGSVEVVDQEISRSEGGLSWFLPDEFGKIIGMTVQPRYLDGGYGPPIVLRADPR